MSEGQTRTEAEATLAVALLAALADGRTGEDEREQIKSLFETLAAEHELPNLSTMHQQVALGRVGIEKAAAGLTSEAARRLAFEMAVCVADADGALTPKEQSFLDQLEQALGLSHDEAVAFERQAVEIAVSPQGDEVLDAGDLLGPVVLEPAEPIELAAPLPAEPTRAEPVAEPVAEAAPSPGPDIDQAALARKKAVDETVLKYAILNGALELLPQNLATMAILPLQTRMVYAIGKQHGYSLDAGHIKEFIATLGLGATSQMLENFARKALGKLVKKTLGKTAGKLVKRATGPMMTFASTYAIGKVAEAYYAGGRRLSAVDLRAMFGHQVDRGKALYEQHRPQIESSAQTLSPARVLDMVRGKTPA